MMQMDWDSYRKKIQYKEILVIIFAVLMAVSGVIFDLLVARGSIFLEVNDFNEVSLVLLQIQATITTLTLTIIALLSGNISDFYMGISISAYFLEIRPVFLKQRRIIVIEFLTLALSVICHLLGEYNSVVMCFFISMVIILVAIFEIYAIFKGRRKSEDEIVLYVNYLIENNNNYLEIGENLLYDWKRVADKQSVEDFDDYSKVFFALISKILSKYKKVDEVKTLAENITMFLLTNESDKCKRKGIIFVVDFYENIWLWINSNPEIVKEIENPILLISLIDREFYSALNIIGVERLEREDFRFERLSEYVIRVASWIGFSEDGQSMEIASINSIARSLGRFLDRQNKKGNIVNSQYWKSIIMDKYGYYSYGIPDNSQRFYKMALGLRDFNVIYGFLLYGQLEYVKDGFFLDGISHTYKVEDVSGVFKTMLVHCFMYYLAFRESNDCVGKTTQENVKNLITDKTVINSVNNYYYRLSENVKVIDAGLEETIRSTLQHYELFPIHSNSKSMILDSVIRDYYLYVVLLLSRFSVDDGLLGRLLNVQEYHTLLMNSNFEALKKRFMDLHKIFDAKELSDAEAMRKTEEMLFDFANVMKEKYKKQIYNEAENHQHVFVTENVQEKTIAKIKETITEKFYKTFNSFKKKNFETRTHERVHIYSVLDFTDRIGEDYRGDQSDCAISNLGEWLIFELTSIYGVKILERGVEFKTDEEFRTYLQSRNYSILLGSQYPFGATDYMNYSKHNDFLTNMDCSFVLGGNRGVALRKNSLYLNLNEVIVEISAPNVDKMELEKSEETGLYKYSPIYGIELEFEKDDLQKYLYNERKVIDIYVNVTIGFSNNSEDATIITRSFDN